MVQGLVGGARVGGGLVGGARVGGGWSAEIRGGCSARVSGGVGVEQVEMPLWRGVRATDRAVVDTEGHVNARATRCVCACVCVCVRCCTYPGRCPCPDDGR